MKNLERVKRHAMSIVFLFAIASAFAVPRTSTGSGAWNVAGTWSPAGIPGSADDITINAGHVIDIINATSYCNNLTINGTLQFTDNAASRLIWNYGNCTISSTGSFSVSAVSDRLHSAVFYGNVTKKTKWQTLKCHLCLIG